MKNELLVSIGKRTDIINELTKTKHTRIKRVYIEQAGGYLLIFPSHRHFWGRKMFVRSNIFESNQLCFSLEPLKTIVFNFWHWDIGLITKVLRYYLIYYDLGLKMILNYKSKKFKETFGDNKWFLKPYLDTYEYEIDEGLKNRNVYVSKVWFIANSKFQILHIALQSAHFCARKFFIWKHHSFRSVHWKFESSEKFKNTAFEIWIYFSSSNFFYCCLNSDFNVLIFSYLLLVDYAVSEIPILFHVTQPWHFENAEVAINTLT